MNIKSEYWIKGYLQAYKGQEMNADVGLRGGYYEWLRGFNHGLYCKRFGHENLVTTKAYKDGKKGLPLPCDAVLKSWRAGRFDGGHI